MQRISEVQITPVKPQGGLVAFASFVLDDCLYLGSVCIFTRPQGGYRLVYPTKKAGQRDLNIFHPLNREFADLIENVVIGRYQEVMNFSNDRYSSLNAGR